MPSNERSNANDNNNGIEMRKKIDTLFSLIKLFLDVF